MAQEKTKVVLGTATPGGGFPAYGWPYAEVLNATDPTLDIEPINTKGSGENVGRIEDGSLDIALATGEVTYEAVNGIGRAPCRNIRIISAKSIHLAVVIHGQRPSVEIILHGSIWIEIQRWHYKIMQGARC